jgi:hypothetical protein
MHEFARISRAIIHGAVKRKLKWAEFSEQTESAARQTNIR